MLDPPQLPSTAGRGVVASLRHLGATVAAQVVALLVPDRGVPPLVRAGRFRLALLIVVAAAGLAAFATADRLDVGPEVRAENAGRPPPDQTSARARSESADVSEDKTDRQIEDEIAKRTAVRQVQLGLGAAIGTPMKIVAVALFLYVLGAYVGGKPTLPRTLAAAAVGALPWALRSGLAAAATWRQPSITSAQVDHLVTGHVAVAADHPFVAELVARADLFALWSLVLWGFGLAAAAEIGRLKSFLVVSVGFTLYVLITTAGA